MIYNMLVKFISQRFPAAFLFILFCVCLTQMYANFFNRAIILRNNLH